MTTDSFERSRATLDAETTIRGLLGTACREAVSLLDATACAVSSVIGDLLVGLDEHSRSARPLAHGHEYLISDFPLTREVVDSDRALRRAARQDGHAVSGRDGLAARAAGAAGDAVTPASLAAWPRYNASSARIAARSSSPS
jgi:hypothetical protein